MWEFSFYFPKKYLTILNLFLGIGIGITFSLLGKNFYIPEKKGIISAILGLGIIIITLIEMILQKKYIYIFWLVNFVFPIGLILALFLIYEYKSEVKQENSNNEKIEDPIIENNEEIKDNENEEKKNEILKKRNIKKI